MYTLYTGEMAELPVDKIAKIGRGATFVVHRKDGRIDSYEYSWPDLTVRLNPMPTEELKDHLRGFLGYVAAGCRKLGVPLPKGLLERIERVKLVLGFEALPDMDAEGRAESILGAIAFNTKSLIFHGGAVYDENAGQIHPPKPDQNLFDVRSN
jgi:hypothetical protein